MRIAVQRTTRPSTLFYKAERLKAEHGLAACHTSAQSIAAQSDMKHSSAEQSIILYIIIGT